MTWTIHAMRDLNRADPLPELGPRVEPTPPAAPAPVSRGDGFLVHPEGTLSTEIVHQMVPGLASGQRRGTEWLTLTRSVK